MKKKEIIKIYCIIFSNLILLGTLTTSCDRQSSEEFPNSLLSVNFNNKKAFVISDEGEAQIHFCKGIKGKGLNLGDFPSIPHLKNTNSSWFSNDKDFSLSIWVKSSNLTIDTTIIISNSDFRKKEAGIYGYRRTNKGFSLYCHNGAWGWNIGNGGLHYLYEPIAENQPIVDDHWHHLAFTYSSNLKEIRLFYDGLNKAIIHIGDLDDKNFRSELPISIGSKGNNTIAYRSFQGAIDNLRISGSVLSPQLIRKEYEKYFRCKEEPKLGTDLLTIVNWNIWHGGTHFTEDKDGFDGIERITELIKNSNADIVLMQETYGAGSRISSCLDFYYYESASTIGAVWGANLSVMSRFPFEDAYMVEKPSNYGNNYAFNNGGVKISLSENNKVIVFSNWYNGRKPEDLDGALKSWDELIKNAGNVPVIYGGDFNSISHLDDGKGNSGHSKLMEKAGFIDSYRYFYPNIEKFPGYSNGGYSSRIDYIYYIGTKLELIEAGTVIPNFKGKEDKTPGYPSDHLGIVAKFEFK